MSIAAGDFFLRLDKLRQDKGERIVDIARICGISPPAVQGWKGGKMPTIENLRLLSDHYGKSVDWLLTGRDGVMTTLRYGFRERLFEAKGATGLDIHGLAKRLGVADREVETLMNEGGDPTLAMVDAFEKNLQPVIDQRRREEPLLSRLANIERLLIKLAGDQP